MDYGDRLCALAVAAAAGPSPNGSLNPCQQAAAANIVGFLTPERLILISISIALGFGLKGEIARATLSSPALPGWTSPTAVSDVFAVVNVPEPLYTLDGGDIPSGATAAEALHDDGVDALVTLMANSGTPFYQTAAQPNGLFGANDVVVIKLNNQWNGRNSTNSDVLKGAIYRLVQHPDGFNGAVIVAENAQGDNALPPPFTWYDNTWNNSQFQDQSYLEIVQAFTGEGYNVCISDWDVLRAIIVDDYDTGDNSSGYVLEDADNTPEELGYLRLSYPKFQINCNGTTLSVSMKQGLWNGSSFDNSALKMINLPVLKRHNAAWGTNAMKNYLGFITTSNASGVRWTGSDSKHCWIMGPLDSPASCTPYASDYGLIARQMARIRMADLNIVDAIWVNPRDNASAHGQAVRQDVLLASTDPFAVDYYASEYVLYPLVVTNGNTGTPEHAQASYQGGWFRTGLKLNVTQLIAEGVTSTILLDDSMTRDEELAQFNVYVVDTGDPSPSTPTPTSTSTATATATQTPIPTETALTPSATPTSTPTATQTPTPTQTSLAPSSTPTHTASPTATSPHAEQHAHPTIIRGIDAGFAGWRRAFAHRRRIRNHMGINRFH